MDCQDKCFDSQCTNINKQGIYHQLSRSRQSLLGIDSSQILMTSPDLLPYLGCPLEQDDSCWGTLRLLYTSFGLSFSIGIVHHLHSYKILA